ncbi:metallophosphoesterase [Rhodobacteraceae bacterium D3-12]|nr:metallophosphoesterase [Rhodobacteraceae bacterium D3-12]
MSKSNGQTMAARRDSLPMFTFAIVSDTHIGPVDGVTPSPWSSNRLANDRARAVVSRVNALAPDFVIHLGDMIHPTPDQATDDRDRSVERFNSIFSQLKVPLHLVPGNHDIGDKPDPSTPAKSCEQAFVDAYQDYFGADHLSFSHGESHFILINGQTINTNSTSEAEQWDWIESELETNSDKRIFMFGHQPLRLSADDEAEHYDNTAEPGRGRLLDLLRKHKVEAWFSGHVHTFFYDLVGATETYVLPATSALRLDYSELFKAPPGEADEFGRNDAPKLGFVLVEVYEDGHVLHHIRSNGETQSEGEAPPATPALPMIHPKLGLPTPIGVELRDPWAKPIEIAYSGVVDAFGRKPARNDYRLLGLWEMGLSHLRVPFEDVRDPETLARMRLLKRAGHRFSTFFYRMPDSLMEEQIAAASDVLDQVNIILSAKNIAQSTGELSSLKKRMGPRLFVSLLRSTADHGQTMAGTFAHSIAHGFLPDSIDEIDALGLVLDGVNCVDGLVFETGHGCKASVFAEDLITAMNDRNLSFSLTVRMGGENPATLTGSRDETAAITCDALNVAATLPPCSEVILDTLTDVDRGYYPRLGLLDRRMNPTAASEAFQRLHAEILSR